MNNPQPLADFFRQHDIDPAAKTVKVCAYRIGSGSYEKICYVINGTGWTTICGEYWFSRKTSAFVYRPAFDFDPPFSQPPADWLVVNQPRISELERYS